MDSTSPWPGFKGLGHWVTANLLYRWRRLTAEGGVAALSVDEGVVSVSEVRRLEERVRKLERMLGRKTTLRTSRVRFYPNLGPK